MSKVSHIKIKENVFNEVAKAMKLADYENFLKGESIFIKVNALSNNVVPGQNTSPYVLEGVLKVLRSKFKNIFIGDANVATVKQVEKAGTLWGYKSLAKKYNATWINLSKQEKTRIEVNGKIFKHLYIPKILTLVDCKITLPVLKMHNVTVLTAALKNQWGCIPEFRHNFHMVANEAIPEINKALKFDFAVLDATICLEDNGPRTGKPIIRNSVFASNDLVALDTVAAAFSGIEAEKVKYLKVAEELGVGTTKYNLVGDQLDVKKLKPAIAGEHPIVRWELFFRKIPVINTIIFKTPLFNIPAFIASRYNSVIWYNLKGKKYAREVIKQNPLYNAEFKNLIK
ncbi:MAG: DUF362 domain-containing protein [Candidatus Nanoarchaeia archaeon]|nr:DUF362 domain-containing protein [Candidatus Nanoarchaeia archaeon]